jgi:hypothetical protein
VKESATAQKKNAQSQRQRRKTVMQTGALHRCVLFKGFKGKFVSMVRVYLDVYYGVGRRGGKACIW